MLKYFLSSLLLIAAFYSQAGVLNKWQVFSQSFIYDQQKYISKGVLTGKPSDFVIGNDGQVFYAIDELGIAKFDGKGSAVSAFPNQSVFKKSKITAMSIDSKGTIYLACTRGLLSYDGKEWKEYLADATSLNAINCIAITGTDKVYISGVKNGANGLSAGISFFNGDSWTPIATEQAFSDTIIQDLTVDGNNHLWMTLGGHKHGLAKFDGKNWKTFNTANGLPTDIVYAICTDANKTYFAMPQGILEYNGEFNLLPYSSKFGKNMIGEMAARNNDIKANSFVIDKNKTFWISTIYGLYELNTSYARIYDALSCPLPYLQVRKMLVDQKNKKWFCLGYDNPMWLKTALQKDADNNPITSYGILANVNGEAFAEGFKVTCVDDKGSNEKIGICLDILEDKDKNIWIPSLAVGLLKFNGTSYVNYPHPKGSLQSSFTSACLSKSNKIFLGTDFIGIKVFENGQVSDFCKLPTMGGAMALAEDADGVLWSAGSGGLSKYENNDWQNYNKRKGNLPSIIVNDVMVDSKKQVWSATQKGLVRYMGHDSFQVFESTKELEFPSDNMQVVREAKDGKIWVGTRKGISIYDGATWTHHEKIEALKLKNFSVKDISFAADGTAYIATDGDGVLIFDGSNWKQWNKANSNICFNQVNAIKVSSNGTIYITSEWSEFADKIFAFGANQDDLNANQYNKKLEDGEVRHMICILEKK